MESAPILPDAELVLIKWLTAQSSLSGILVTSHLPDSGNPGGAYNGTQKVVRVYRTGGFIDNRLGAVWIDHARLDVDAFGPNKTEAYNLVAKVRSLILGDLIWADQSALPGLVKDVTEYVGPQWFDEPEYPPAGRYILQLGVTLHPVT